MRELGRSDLGRFTLGFITHVLERSQRHGKRKFHAFQWLQVPIFEEAAQVGQDRCPR